MELFSDDKNEVFDYDWRRMAIEGLTEEGKVDVGTDRGGRAVSAHNLDYSWSYPTNAGHIRYKYPTLASDRTSLARARADPLASRVEHDVVLLWNDASIQRDKEEAASEVSSIEDVYQRLFDEAVRHREELRITLRDAGMEEVTGHGAASFTSGSCQHHYDIIENTQAGAPTDTRAEQPDTPQGQSSSRLATTIWNTSGGDEDGSKSIDTGGCESLWKDFLERDGVVWGALKTKSDLSYDRTTNYSSECPPDVQNLRGAAATDRLSEADNIFNSNSSNSSSSSSSSNNNNNNNNTKNKNNNNNDCSSSDSVLQSVEDDERDNVSNPNTNINAIIHQQNPPQHLVDTDTDKLRSGENCAGLPGGGKGFPERRDFGNTNNKQPSLEHRSGYYKLGSYIEQLPHNDHKWSAHDHWSRVSIGHKARPQSEECSDMVERQLSTHAMLPLDASSPYHIADHVTSASFSQRTTDHLSPVCPSQSFTDHPSPVCPPQSSIEQPSPIFPYMHITDHSTPITPSQHFNDHASQVAPPHHITDHPVSLPLVKCSAPDCGHVMRVDEARHKYKNCHNCSWAYYCGRDCRRRDWTRHKHEECHVSRVSSACKQILRFCSLDLVLKAALSRLARRGYLTLGRGCVLLGFPDLSAAERFLMNGISRERLELLPIYVSLRELKGCKMYGGTEVVERLVNLCHTYNPDQRFLLNVGIGWNCHRQPYSGISPTPNFEKAKTFPASSTIRARADSVIDSSTPSQSASRTLFNFDVSLSSMNSTHSPAINQSTKGLSPTIQPSRHSINESMAHTTIDSAYNSLSRSPKSPRSRARSGSMGSEDVGYGSLADVRDSVSEVTLSALQDPFPESPRYSNMDSAINPLDTGARYHGPIVQKCARLRLHVPTFEQSASIALSSSSSSSTISSSSNIDSQNIQATCWRKKKRRKRCLGGPTLILTGVPGSWYVAQEEFRGRQYRQCDTGPKGDNSPDLDLHRDQRIVELKTRELIFANIQRRLRHRGVNLLDQFPDIYAELSDYVAGLTDHFPSRIIYPVSRQGEGRRFTCVLMPQAEPHLRWTTSQMLLHNLDISRESTYAPFLYGYRPDRIGMKHSRHWGGGSHGAEGTGGSHGTEGTGGSYVTEGTSCAKGDSGDISGSTVGGDADSPSYDMDTTIGGGADSNTRLQHRSYTPTWLGDRQSFSLCPRCGFKTMQINQSSQTEGGIDCNQTYPNQYPIRTVDSNEPDIDLNPHCPTSLHTRRKVNTNYPLFSFPPYVLDVYSSMLTDYKNSNPLPTGLTSFLLGHLACRSVLLRHGYNNCPHLDHQVTSSNAMLEDNMNVDTGQQNYVSSSTPTVSRQARSTLGSPSSPTDKVLIRDRCGDERPRHSLDVQEADVIPPWDEMDHILSEWQTDKETMCPTMADTSNTSMNQSSRSRSQQTENTSGQRPPHHHHHHHHHLHHQKQQHYFPRRHQKMKEIQSDW